MALDTHLQTAAEEPLSLWTTWCDYSATGEGRHLFAHIAPAATKEQAVHAFEQAFGGFFAVGCIAEPGVARNEVTTYLFSEQALAFAEGTQHHGALRLVAHLHVNFS
jgi:succinylarginine dihydrolase